MSEPASNATEGLLMEIIMPTRHCGPQLVCDCCRKARSAHEFDEDGFAICAECLSADALPVDFEASVQSARSDHFPTRP
jgi:hypothetical protein